MNGKVILLTGPPAAGKSTLARTLEGLIEPLRRVDFGQLLLEHKQKTNSKLTYEEMRAKSSGVISAGDVAAMDALLVANTKKWRSETNVIIDSHAVTKEPFGFRVTSFHQNLVSELNLDAVIVLNCEPEELVRRIENNPEGRPLISIEEARQHIYLQSSLAILYGVLCGCPTFILDGKSSPVALAKELILHLDSLGMVYQWQ